jgi:fido (protein-threonine AMPylation protein)
MTKLIITYPPGATPLDPDELAELNPDYITTQSELNELEQKNIQQAFLWLQKRRAIDPLNLDFSYELHKQMFSQVWKWAGRTRTSGKNIGIDWHQISTQLAQLLANTKY